MRSLIKNTEIDMLNGPIFGKIMRFGIPLILTNVLQLLFNAADIAVAGRFAGSESLAAVGATGSLVFLIINILIGISVGVNVVVARYYGMGQKQESLSKAIHTAIFVAIVGGIIFGTIGFALSGVLLKLIGVPAKIYPLSLIYMRIFFIGLPFNMLYNYCTAILRAKGDTTRPFFYLLISGTVNVILNLIFVIVFHMGVAGVALATDLSNCLSAFLIMRYMMKSKDELHVELRKIKFDLPLFKSMAQIGVPAGLQSSLFSVSNAVIQSAINSYGPLIMAACSASSSIENFVYIGMNAFHQAAQTFTSQNIAAGKRERVKSILKVCLLCTTIVGGLICLVELAFGESLIGIYNTSPKVIAAGVERLHIIVIPYLIFGYGDVLVGVIRGHGISLPPVVINLLATCVFRIIWITILDIPKVSANFVYFSYPISWSLLLLALIGYWLYMGTKAQSLEKPAF